MNFGRMGARGGFGSLGVLGGARGAVPAAPVLAMDPAWDTSQATPIFDIDAAWADQDDLQFEIQVSGGDWSGATVTHHTVTTSEISGGQISLGFGLLSAATYQARCKFKHFGGSYSSYSNIQAFTIAPAIAFSITNTASSTSTATTTTVDYGTISIGTADTNRVVAVAIMARIGATATVTGVNIGGVAATQVTGAAASPSLMVTDIWYAQVPTGTTADITVTYGSAPVVSGIQAYRIITGTPIPTDGQHNSSATVSNAAPLSKSVTIPTGGGMIGSFGFLPTTNGLTMTWSGGTITKDIDVNLNTTGRYFSAAHDTTDSGLTTITVTPSSQTNSGALSLAAWSK